MVRIGNGRAAVLADAKAQLNVLLTETTTEGKVFRRAQELQLERAHIPMFPLFWTLMHVLDERSPLTLEIEELPPVADRHASERNDIPLFEVALHDGPGADHIGPVLPLHTGTQSLQTRRWRKRDSNLWSHLHKGQPFSELAVRFPRRLHRLRAS
jgi:hypothetical protein